MQSPLLSFICVSLLLGMQTWCLLTSSKRPRLTSSSSSNATVHTLAQNTLKHDNNSSSSSSNTEYETHVKKMARRFIIIRCCGRRSCSPSRTKARKLAIARITNTEVSITCPRCDQGWQTLLNLKSNTSQGIPVKCIECPLNWKSRLDFAKVDLWGDPRVLVIGLKKTKESTVKVKIITTTTAETDDTSDDTSDTDEMTVTSTMKSAVTQTKVQTMQTVALTTKATTLTNITTVRAAASNITTIRTGSTLQIHTLLGVSMTVFRATVTSTTRRVETTTTEEETTDYEEGARRK